MCLLSFWGTSPESSIFLLFSYIETSFPTWFLNKDLIIIVIVFRRRMNKNLFLMMLKKCYLVKHTIGEIGAYVEVETVFTSGQMLQPWNCLMVVMDGSDLFWMANLLQCIPVGVLKEELIVQVGIT